MKEQDVKKKMSNKYISNGAWDFRFGKVHLLQNQTLKENEMLKYFQITIVKASNILVNFHAIFCTNVCLKIHLCMASFIFCETLWWCQRPRLVAPISSKLTTMVLACGYFPYVKHDLAMHRKKVEIPIDITFIF